MVKVEVFFGAITRIEGQTGSFVKKLTVTRRGSIITHPNYLDSGTANDVGLLELPEDAPVGNGEPRAGVIPLPQGADAANSFENEMGTVSGFGRFLNIFIDQMHQ